jgi:Fibronectin type III domain
VGRVAVGSYELVVGDSAGTAIAPAAGEPGSRPLARAIARSGGAHSTPRTGVESLEGAEDAAAKAASKAEVALSLFTQIAEGRLDPASISDECIDDLFGALGRFDRDGHRQEVLRLARSLVMLLLLLRRWAELLRSLWVALGAAERLGDEGAKAWALHELGTLHLAADKHADADYLLGQAHDLRERIGDRRGLTITDRNLQVLCRAVRAQLPRSRFQRALAQIPRRPAAALLLGALALAGAGVAGAVIRGPGNTHVTTTGTTTVVAPERSKPTTTSAAAGTGNTSEGSTGTGNTGTGSTGPGSTGTGNTPPPANKPPSAPAGVTASAGEGDVAVTWTAPAGGGSAITSYTVTPYIGSSARPTTTVSGAPPATSVTIAGLANDTTYTFTVAATNAAGTGPASERSNAVGLEGGR